jgi:hypothetical protein
MGEHALSLMVLFAIVAIVLSIEHSIITPLNRLYLTIGHINKTDVPNESLSMGIDQNVRENSKYDIKTRAAALPSKKPN